MKKFFRSFIGIVIILIGFVLFKLIAGSKETFKPSASKTTKTVLVKQVKNGDVPLVVLTNGRLVAKRRIELFSEVQGILRGSDKPFKEGQHFKRGRILAEIDNSEFSQTVQAKRSDFYNLIITNLADLRLDFPKFYPKWQQYIENFDMQKQLTDKLPEMHSKKEIFFINSRGITTSYHNLKNLERRLNKYTMIAPFDGVLTEALINKGTLIRNSQKLGEFIDPTVFELEINMRSNNVAHLKIGKSVLIFEEEESEETWLGKVVRINDKVNTETQTISVFIEVSGKNLKEGMYLNARIDAGTKPNTIKISREILTSDNEVYIVKDSVLDIIKVTPVYLSRDKAIVKGIEDNTLLVTNAVLGAFKGMPVKTVQAPN